MNADTKGGAPAPDRDSFGFTEDQLREQPTVYADGLFAGRTVLVSGAGSGLGKAIAALFARLGADLVVCGRDAKRLAAAADFFRGLGAEVTAETMTIRDPDQVQHLIDLAWDRHGGIDVLINNAGGQFAQPSIDFSVKGWNAVVDTNLNGTWYMMQTAARRWRDAGRPGVIVNITAAIGRGLPHMAHSAAARGGVVHASKTVAVEWAPYDIRINCLAVGTVESSGFANYSEEGRRTFYDSNPMRRAGDVWDVAEACVYLSAPSSKFITGEVLALDGGQQLWGDFWAAGKPDYFKV